MAAVEAAPLARRSQRRPRAQPGAAASPRPRLPEPAGRARAAPGSAPAVGAGNRSPALERGGHLAVGHAERLALLDPPHHLVGRQRAARRAPRAQRARSTPSRGTRAPSSPSIALGAVEAAHERLLEELEVAMVPAGELALELRAPRRGRPRAPRRAPRVSSKRSGFRLCGMMLDPVARSGGQHEIAELLGAEEDHVAATARPARAPAGRTRTAPPPRACRGRPAPWPLAVEPGESERARRGLAPERQRHAVARRAPERRAVHPAPRARRAPRAVSSRPSA